MKLSDAILLGSLNHNQCVGSYFRRDIGSDRLSVCALGSISSTIEEFDEKYLGENPHFGYTETNHYLKRMKEVREKFPQLTKIVTYNGKKVFLDSFIMTLNDTEGKTLAEIAEIVAKIEKDHPEWYADTEDSKNTVETEYPEGVLSTA